MSTAAAGRRTSRPGRDPEGAFEFGGRLGMSDLRRVVSSDDDDVERRLQEPAPLSEYLPDDPLDAVSHHRVADPRADRDSQPRDR
jgi:hypothetical protein